MVYITCPKMAKQFFLNQKNYVRASGFFSTHIQKVFLHINKYGTISLSIYDAFYMRKIMGRMLNFDLIQNNYDLILSITNSVIDDLNKSNIFYEKVQ